MAEGGDGFMGRCEVVDPRGRGKRHWPDDVESADRGLEACSPVSG